VAARSKAQVCGRSLAGIAVSNPAGVHGCLSVVRIVGCQVEVSVSGSLPVERGPTECNVPECDHEASIMRIPCLTRGYCITAGGGGG
jgi:hypothetical protein